MEAAPRHQRVPVKAARFVRFCDAFNIPLITVRRRARIPAGHRQEYGGIIRHGAKLLYASARLRSKADSDHRKAYGGAYCVMCSKHIRADFNVAWRRLRSRSWPEARSTVVFHREWPQLANPVSRRRELVTEYTERFANPYIAAERGYIDDVIEPGRTRES